MKANPKKNQKKEITNFFVLKTLSKKNEKAENR